MIWNCIQIAKKKKDLHVMFLDLEHAFESVPNSLITRMFDFFRIPTKITKLVQNYFSDLQFFLTTPEYTTDWQLFEVCITVGYTLSPLAIIMAMEVII